MLASVRWYVFACGIASTTADAEGQELVRVEQQNGRVRVVNELPIPAAVQVTRVGSAMLGNMQAVLVPARSWTELDSREGARIVRIEPADARVPIPQVPSCTQGSQLGLPSADELRRAVADLQVADSPEAQRVLSLAAYRAEVRSREAFEQFQLNTDDAERDELRRQFYRNAAPAAAAAQARGDALGAVAAGVGAFLDMSGAYSEIASAERNVARQQRDVLKPLIGKGELALRVLREDLAIISREIGGAREFNDRVMRELDRGAVPSGILSAHSGVQRLCGDAQVGSEDRLVFSADASPSVNALIAGIRYDNGSTGSAIARRVTGTSQWVMRIPLPVDASSVDVLLRQPGERAFQLLATSLSAGRPSLTSVHGRLEQALAAMSRQLKQAEFDAKGGKEVRSLVIP